MCFQSGFVSYSCDMCCVVYILRSLQSIDYRLDIPEPSNVKNLS